MKKKGLIIVGIVVLFLLILLFKNTRSGDRYFNKISLDGYDSLINTNVIVNNTNIGYLDTIILVGLNELEIKNVKLIINILSLETKNNFKFSNEIELKAHIRYVNNIYYVWLDKTSKEEMIGILSHELIHLKQYNSGELTMIGSIPKWGNEEISLEKVSYEDRPWEIDAFSKDKKLEEKIKKILFN